MEGTKYRLTVLLLFLSWIQIMASDRSEVYSAYINNRMDIWKNVIDKMQAKPEKDDEFLLELINYQYGYIGYCIGFDKKEEAKTYLGIAQKNVSILEKHKYNLSAVNSYKAALYGYRIGLNPISAPVNGLKSIDCARNAVELDSTFYFGYVQYGNIQFYMPSAFGGSKKKALEYYLKAREILDKNPEQTKEDWNYMSLLIVIGQTYTYLKDYNSAKDIYEHILKLEPGFLYVKDDLYPKLLKKKDN